MVRSRFIIVAVVLLALASSSAFATDWYRMFNLQDTLVAQLLGLSWGCTTDAQGNKIPTWDRLMVWDQCVGAVPVGTFKELLQNAVPIGFSDPRIRQTVVNSTVSDIWTDWHVEIQNGTNLRNISVYKVGVSPNWVVETYNTVDGVGFFAHVISQGAGNPMAVNPLQSLYVDFTYDAVAGKTPNIIQYPTTSYTIPEPGSIMALLMGIGALGFGSMRRLKK